MTKSFYTKFCTQIKEIYKFSPPGRVYSTSTSYDLPNNWIIFQFNIDHPRKVDEVGIRWSGQELTVDFLPGGAIAIPICCIDDYGLRWVQMSYFSVCPILKPEEKTNIEGLITDIYGFAQYYKSYLRFILGYSAKVRVKEKKS